MSSSSFFNGLVSFGHFQQRVGGYVMIACVVLFVILGIIAMFKKKQPGETSGNKIKTVLMAFGLAGVFGLGSYMSFSMAKNTSEVGRAYTAAYALGAFR